MQVSTYGITAETIAQRAGITVQAVRKKAGIEAYVTGKVSNGGRPATLYSPEVFELFPQTQSLIDASPDRQIRSDVGTSRKASDEQWERIWKHIFEYFMANAEINLRLACEQAEHDFKSAGEEWPWEAYRKLKKKDISKADGHFISEYWRDDWEGQHQKKWRKHDYANSGPYARKDVPAMWESLGWAGPGFGAMRGWVIDGRSADVWMRHGGAGEVIPGAIYYRDGLTGYPLHVEPLPYVYDNGQWVMSGETSEVIIAGFLKAMWKHQTAPDLVVCLDNGKAMISERTKGVISSVLPQEAFDRAKMHPEIFGKRDPKPLVTNLPNIPRKLFKAALERSFLTIKREHDATRFPQLYQGGDRKSGVQLRVSNQPVFPTDMPAPSDYFQSLDEYLMSDHIRRARPGMFPGLAARGIVSIEQALDYYGQTRPDLPSGERLAYLLYWTMFAQRKGAFPKVHNGMVDSMIDGKLWHVVDEKLVPWERHRVAVVPIPGSKRDCLLLVADDPKVPRYIGQSINAIQDDFADMVAVTQRVNATRDYLRDRHDSSDTPQRTWTNRTEPIMLPERPVPMLTATPEPDEPATETAGGCPPPEIEIDADTADLLRQIDEDLY